MVKTPPDNAGDARDVDSIPGLGRSPGERNGNPLQYSCLGNSMDRGAWWARVHGIAKSWTRLSTHTHVSDYINCRSAGLKYYVFYCFFGEENSSTK